MRPGSGARPTRAIATPLGLQVRMASWTQTTVLQPGFVHTLPARLRGQQAAAERAIGTTTQLVLARHQVQAHLATGEQVELFVGLDQLIGVQGPGGTGHRGLLSGGATLAERLVVEKPRRPRKSLLGDLSPMHAHHSSSTSGGCSAGQTFSSNRGCAATAGWMPSGCIMPGTPPTPSRKKGTKDVL